MNYELCVSGLKFVVSSLRLVFKRTYVGLRMEKVKKV